MNIEKIESMPVKFRALITTVYLAAIYAVLPFSGDVVLSLTRHHLMGLVVTVTYLVAGALLVGAMLFLFRIKDVAAYILLSMMALIIAYFLSGLEVQQERVHFVQYAILTGCLIWCFSTSPRRKLAWVAAVVVSSFAGLIDEGIQGVVPNRYFDWRDVALNVAASLAGAGIFAMIKAYAVVRESDSYGTSRYERSGGDLP